MAIERLKIGREFDLTSWEEAAFHELCMRDEAITAEEANILGLDTFVRIANIREKEQRRRGKEIDARAQSESVQTELDAPRENDSAEYAAHSLPSDLQSAQNGKQITCTTGEFNNRTQT